ncbi:MAG: VOC family protein [Actinomycetota bacterium]|nr:VOC family protein [Actinomycetota bacterium]
MKAKSLAWGGVKTERYDEMKRFLAETIGLEQQKEEKGMAVFTFPNGDTFEVFGPDDDEHGFFTTGPVMEFAVDDVEAARAELEASDLELLSPVRSEGGFVWFHFRGPDGNVYGLTQLS